MKKIISLIFVLSLCIAANVANADFTFGEPVNLKEVIPVIDPDYECIDCLSYDGLEIARHATLSTDISHLND